MSNQQMKPMFETMRWYGPEDPVSLKYIKQAGATGVITSLHHIPYGEAWPVEEIAKRIQILKNAGLTWNAVESVPVHEDIKTRSGNYEKLIENYKTTLTNLGSQGIDVVIYNFMPVLDWVRTDLKHVDKDGSECLLFDPVQFAAFEIYLLKRENAEKDYTPEQLAKAKIFFDSLSDSQKVEFERSLIDVFPGTKMGLKIEDVRKMLAKYSGIDKAKLTEHYKLFLEAVIPVAEKAGVKLAVHPDDPPWSILGLPRIVTCREDIKNLLTMVPSQNNGLCFCTGSYSARLDNNLPAMIEEFGSRIHVAHLRSTQKNEDGSFYEANHLEGSVPMVKVVQALLNEQKRRLESGRKDWQLSFRPDHGHTMADDLAKPAAPNPGYTYIGRLKGLAEIRGVQTALVSMM